MEAFIAIIIVQLVLIIAALMQFIESTFIHEWGHLRTARLYEYTKAEITLKFAIPLFSIKGCEVKRDKTLKSEGHIWLENEYAPYTDLQIRDIAIAGAHYAAKFCLLVGITELVIIYVLVFNFLAGSEYEFVGLVDIVLSFVVTILFTFLQEIKYRTAKEEWCDRNIANNQAGFKEYLRREKVKEND